MRCRCFMGNNLTHAATAAHFLLNTYVATLRTMANTDTNNGLGVWSTIITIVIALVLYALNNTNGNIPAPQPTPSTHTAKHPRKSHAKTTATTDDSTTTNGYDPAADKDLALGTLDNYLPAENKNETVQHTYYTLSFVDAHKQAEWVAYELTRTRCVPMSSRTEDFRPDPAVSTGSAVPSDYSSSGYDRGHLCPAQDMAFDAEAMSETFFMSNMSPQVPDFNRGIWKMLEARVRKYAKHEKHLYVVTGPILPRKGRKAKNSIGRTNTVTVPEAYYKVLLVYTNKKAKGIAYILPNAASNELLDSYAVSIDEVERQTGLDFFPNLPNDVQNEVEANDSLDDWQR